MEHKQVIEFYHISNSWEHAKFQFVRMEDGCIFIELGFFGIQIHGHSCRS